MAHLTRIVNHRPKRRPRPQDVRPAVLASGVALAAALALAAPPARGEDAVAPAPLLPLEDAIEAARRHNHQLAITALDVDRAEERRAAFRTRRLPAFRLDGFGGRQLNDLELKIPAGSLGTPLAAFPPTAGSLSVPADWFGVGMASVGQPLTQQYRIGLGLESLRLDREVASEDVRREQQRLDAEVRTTYFQISANEAGVLALRDLIRAIE